MKKKIKSALIPLMLLAVVFLFCACGRGNTQFDKNDGDGYNVSVKFDANGGEFTTDCYVIYDTFNISGMATNSNGKVDLALITPDNEIRGANDTYNVRNNGYFLAGWYATRTENPDGEGYTYADKWDFENGRLEVDPNKEYTSAEPVLTLYAVWVPMFEINFYNMNTGELMDTEVYDPNEVASFKLPAWNEKTGAMDMYQFPKNMGYTFNGAYLDAAGTQPIEGELKHTGSVDYENGTARNPVMDVYIDWVDGEWFHIYTAEQLARNATRNGCYVLYADLDFANADWPNTFMSTDFGGTIVGNGHTISNVTLTQTNSSATRFGLFGGLTADAKLQDVTFQNITAIIQAGVRASGAAFGLFAGNISAGATMENISLLNGKLMIDPECMLTSNDYVIGMICGQGNASQLHYENIEVLEVKPEVEPGEPEPADKLQITVEDDGTVIVVKNEA